MQPLKITAKMQDGRVAGTDPYFPLDSIMAAEWMRRNHPEAYYNASSHLLTNDLIVPDLPLARCGEGEDWYFACSFNTIPPIAEYIMYWHKRFDDQLEQYIEFKGKRGKVDVRSGKNKAYRMPLVVQLFDYLQWFAVGHLESVRELISTITHIGKKTSQGLGGVDYWEVEPWPEDWSVVRDGKLTRAIPVESGFPEEVQESRIALYGIRNPYWHTSNQRVCIMPEVIV